MEQIFLLLWLADLVGNIAIVGWGAVFGLALGLIFAVLLLTMTDETREIPNRLARMRPYFMAIAVVLAVAVLVPNRSTIQVLAMTRAGEVAATTQLGTKAMLALDAVLDKVISQAKEK